MLPWTAFQPLILAFLYVYLSLIYRIQNTVFQIHCITIVIEHVSSIHLRIIVNKIVRKQHGTILKGIFYPPPITIWSSQQTNKLACVNFSTSRSAWLLDIIKFKTGDSIAVKRWLEVDKIYSLVPKNMSRIIKVIKDDWIVLGSGEIHSQNCAENPVP
jgi:hypothetical protein